MQRSKIGAHTMTLVREVIRDDMEHIIDVLGVYSERTKKRFLSFSGSSSWDGRRCLSFSDVMDTIVLNKDVNEKDDIQSPFLPRVGFTVSHPGLKEFSAFVYRYYHKKTGRYRHKYYIYLKVEPLTLIEGEQNIRLFELEDADHREELKEAFGREVSDLFDIEHSNGGITDLDTWNTDRMDYTIDVKVDSKNEILIFKNLCKFSVMTSKRNKLHYSARGDKFYEYGLLYGNDSWTLAIYDKQDQIRDTYNDIDPAVKEKLMAQAENLMRIEVRSEKGKVKSISQSLENGRNIMGFLDVDVAKRLFQKIYGKEIGYKDFFRKYYAEKKLDEALPMTRAEKKMDRDAAKKAHEHGMEYEHETHSNKYKRHRAFLMEVLERRGLKNVREAMLGRLADKENLSEEDKKEKAAILTRLRYEINVIRKKVGISPVIIPEDWKYGEKRLNLPKEKLENPLSDLCPDTNC